MREIWLILLILAEDLRLQEFDCFKEADFDLGNF